MTDTRLKQLKEHYLLKKDTNERMRMAEFIFHVKHESRMNSRERHRGEIEKQYMVITDI